MKLKRTILNFALLFATLFQTAFAVVQTESEIAGFLAVLHDQLPEILDDNLDEKNLYESVSVLVDGGPSFINSVYLITLKDGRELVIKIGNPVWKGSKTLNEVAALSFLKKNSMIPVPEILAFDSDSDHSAIRNEYIIMPRVEGRPLSSEIGRIYSNKPVYFQILDQLASIIAQLKSFRFASLGNFAFSDENELEVMGIVDFANYQMNDSCKKYSEYASHALKFYIIEMRKLLNKQNQDAWIYEKYIPLLQDVVHNADFTILDDHDSFVFCHQDFVMKNILVNESKITAVLDWEWSGAALPENESMTGFDFLLNADDKLYFSKALEKEGVNNFFAPPRYERQLFYRLIGNVYTLVAFREWKEGKLEHTAKFLSQKLEQRKIRNDPNFDMDEFIRSVMIDLDNCIEEFY